jgi:hypothetical protein
MKINIYVLFFVLAFSLVRLAKIKTNNNLLPYTVIEECKVLGNDPKLVKIKHYDTYLIKKNEGKCPVQDIYIYTSKFYKIINCFLRTDLEKAINMPDYVRDSIKNISKALKGPEVKGFLSNLNQKEVYRNSRISNKDKIKVGSLWKNLSFMSTSVVKGANSLFDSEDGFRLILSSSKFNGKEISKCSEFEVEKEFLIDVGQCWKVEKFEEKTRDIFLNQVECVKGEYFDL